MGVLSRIWRWCGRCAGSAGVVGLLLAGMLGGPPASVGQANSEPEIKTEDAEPTFRLQVQRNMVLVRVVVRDSKGRPVGKLRKEDFRLFDSGKPQVIAQFAVESSARWAAKEAPAREVDAEARPETELAASAPRNYMALFFDDIETEFEDLARTRDAAGRYLDSMLQPGDRVAIFTASGQTTLDFTDDRPKLHETLLQLRNRPTISDQQRCPELTDYLSYMIVHRRDPTAIAIATEETYDCYYANSNLSIQEARAQAQSDAEGYATQALNLYETRSAYALRGLMAVIRRVAAMPGRHSVIFICPGFLWYTEMSSLDDIVDRALRSNVIVNTFDPRGLYTIVPYGDASRRPVMISTRPDLMGRKQQVMLDGYTHAAEMLRNIAIDTGGEYFQNSNDLDAGFRRLGTLANVYYTLAFSPQNLKLDGRFHNLKVTLANPAGLTVLARRGYFAPRKPVDASLQAKEEIEQAVFSQDEVNELPVEVHTQFFKVNETDARLSVLTHLDLRPLHFRKEEGRNLSNLTFVTVLFDRDGKFVSGREKRLELRLRDPSLERLLASGITMKISFDLKAGNYLVRQVVRDADDGQISGLNRTVEIPY